MNEGFRTHVEAHYCIRVAASSLIQVIMTGNSSWVGEITYKL